MNNNNVNSRNFDELFARIVAAQIKEASKNGTKSDLMLKYFMEEPSITTLASVSGCLRRNETINVCGFEWHAEQFLRLRQNFWLDDIVVNSIATLLITKANVSDKLLDSILLETPTARQQVDMHKYRFVYAPLFDRSNLHFQLLIMDANRSTALFLDPNPKQTKVTKQVTAALRARLERSIPELTAIATLTCVYPQATQRNDYDCGLMVLSYISEQIGSDKLRSTFAEYPTRAKLLEIVLAELPEMHRARVAETFNQFDTSNGRLIVGMTNEKEIRTLQLTEEQLQQYLANLQKIVHAKIPADLESNLCAGVAFYHQKYLYNYSFDFI